MQAPAALVSNERKAEHYVLIVDDDDDIRGSLREILELEGYRTVCASNGAEALELLRRAPEPPSLILLDLMMPEMDGWEFLMRIDEDPVLYRIAVALTSAHPSVRRALDKYRDEIRPKRLLFPKPLSLLRLLSTVRHFCSDEATSPTDPGALAADEWGEREAPTSKFVRLGN